MRTHGWRGDPPDTDEEARARIVEATRRCVDRFGPRKTALTDVAEDLGVTRATVYRYFRNIEELLKASSLAAAGEFLQRLVAHVSELRDASEILVEMAAFTIERLPREPQVGVLIGSGHTHSLTDDLLSPLTIEITRSMLLRLPVDWAAHGYAPADLDGLAEFMLRLLRSFLPESTRHLEHGQEMPDPRPFLRRWIVPGFLAQPT
ncbi:MAG: TetR/AcrR family transcriptional regulator [Streptosporangiaceae bacterium]